MPAQHFFPYEKIFIVDDFSDDEQTINFLSQTEHKVLKFPKTKTGSRGGLYNNINKAILHAKENGYEYCIIAFDDHQIVRKVDVSQIQQDIEFLERNKSQF